MNQTRTFCPVVAAELVVPDSLELSEAEPQALRPRAQAPASPIAAILASVE